MKKLLLLVLAFFPACTITYQMGETPEHFEDANYGKGIAVVERTAKRIVYKHCKSYDFECEYYYFDRTGLYMIDKVGNKRELSQDTLK